MFVKEKSVTTLNKKMDFPVLNTTMRGNRLVYLDNAATTQKPTSVLEAMNHFLTKENGTVNRGVYYLSQEATKKCDDSRKSLKTFLNAKSEKEIIFVKGTTEAINLVAYSYGELMKPGDEILITELEHHANIVPWQQLCLRRGCILKVAPITDDGHLDINAYKKLLSEKTKLVSFCHISNSIGTINPARELVKLAKEVGAKVLIDGAQAVSHLKVDVQDLDCDFYAFSGHKCFGPTGVGVLYGREDLLEKMPPFMTGGDMIETVSFQSSSFAELPRKFEAGTPAIVEIIGLGEAVKYMNTLDYKEIQNYEQKLLEAAQEKLNELDITLIGPTHTKAAIVSFVMNAVHAHDVGTVLDMEGVAVRVGHHCTQPLMKRYNVSSTIRASFCFYNDMEDVDALINGLKKVKEFLG
ncbi:cysteine desulfurase [bacterium]|jgi:cysteine desulfurase / selenocysteine lyase|nr:cysteine desulfurase [bacterium]